MKFSKLGEVVNTTGRNEAEIKSETALQDFGLLITAESTLVNLQPVRLSERFILCLSILIHVCVADLGVAEASDPFCGLENTGRPRLCCSSWMEHNKLPSSKNLPL